ncbi:sulfurtransferase [Thiotrichales bacterium 19S9-12]|nr:sulfurtransferase [Thiotrichales bacterium 19S9-11]MCF6811075.1 sulfurtransferase [Thiotrichales bacterium 19S9-12]
MNHSQEFLDLVDDALTRVNTCELEDVNALINDPSSSAIIIDVRDENEFNQGYIPKAMHLSKGLIEVKIVQAIPNKEAEIILYCGGGNRSALAADNLQKMGYTHVKSMNLGYKGWLKQGYITEGSGDD